MSTTAYAYTKDAGLKDEARAMAVQTLMASPSFKSMDVDEQRVIYADLVQENMHKLARQKGLVQPMADKGPGAGMGFGGYNPGFEESVDAFEDLVDSVDFPKFVADLLKAVFDANITVMKKQTDDYIRLMREATKGVADFVKKVKDDDTFAYLAETKGNQFNISMEKDANGGQKMTLTNPEGEPVDMEDNEVKAKIMEAKIAMAKEHRAALREVILMGVTRLVVEKGEVEAGVEFRITANRNSTKSKNSQNINTTNAQMEYGGGFMGAIFGGPSGSVSMTNTNIQVNASNKEAKDELFAKLHGKVNIKFKTDYFKLDNFAQMYADGGVAALKPAAPQAQIPAGAAPR
ncbi:MAG TPA: hypothetical protein VHK69_00125 [Chitinophagaceae bacterium]|jgi:hypothetical protein|nr:hypothetical protein [Chitinophagaceae bacterium]